MRRIAARHIRLLPITSPAPPEPSGDTVSRRTVSVARFLGVRGQSFLMCVSGRPRTNFTAIFLQTIWPCLTGGYNSDRTHARFSGLTNCDFSL